MLNELNTYYQRFIGKFSPTINKVWQKHIFVENTYGFSHYYTSPANYKYFFYIFYSIKSKMILNPNYNWSNVLEDYSVEDIVKKLYCHGLKFIDFLDIFDIKLVDDQGYNILTTIDGVWFNLKDDTEYTQLYIE